MIDKSIFRAYDIRGVVGETLTVDFAYKLGVAYCHAMRARGMDDIAVGYDGRLHSPMLAQALLHGLSDGGVKVTDIGVAPTPMTYFATHSTDALCAIMVTGSHNPPEYNGFKCVMNRQSFYGDDLLELYNVMITLNVYYDANNHVKSNIKKSDISDSYINKLLQSTILNHIPDTLNCVWDAGNGAAGEVLKLLLPKLPGIHTLINGDIDGTFPAHHPDPSDPKNMAQLQREVLKNNADVGLAFDGDGDRLGVIDENGAIISSDALLSILATNVLNDNAGAKILGDVKTSNLFFNTITKLGGQGIIWMVGHAHMKKKMKETGAMFAGEGSGHIFFADRYLGYDDALYAALRLLECLNNQKLSTIISAMPVAFASPEIRVFCDDNKKFHLIDELRNIVSAQGIECLTIDGIRAQTPDGWWLVRASNTQPA